MQLDHEARRTGIGASEIAAVLGLSSYASPYDLWMLKTGQAQPDMEAENDAQIFGNLLEDVIAREYARRNNCKVQKVKGMIVSKQYPWLFCSPDRKRVGAQINVQVKTAGMFARGWGEEETDNIPNAYLVQVQQEMIVTGLPVTHIPVLVAGQKYRLIIPIHTTSEPHRAQHHFRTGSKVFVNRKRFLAFVGKIRRDFPRRTGR